MLLPASASAAVIVDSVYLSASACVYWSTGTPDFSCSTSDANSTGLTATHATAVAAGAASVEYTAYVATTQSGVTSFGATGAGSGTTGTAGGDAAYIVASGSAQYWVDFSLTEAYSYVLSGSLAGISNDLDPAGNNYQLALYGEGGSPMVLYLSKEGNATDLVMLSGVLAPGSYTLVTIIGGRAAVGPDYGYGSAGGTGFASSSFNLALTPVAAAIPVPEPASMLLAGTGLLGAGVRRWRQKRS